MEDLLAGVGELTQEKLGQALMAYDIKVPTTVHIVTKQCRPRVPAADSK